jgi:lysophospholipase L1-like esterase
MNRGVRIAATCFVLVAAGMLSAVGVSGAEVPPPIDVRGFSASLGPSGEVWAVWSADNGHDTDLVYSRWTGQSWLSPGMLYIDPATWDDFPSLSIAADGTPWVAWTSANQDQSHLYVSRWVGYRWSAPEEVPAEPSSQPRQAALATAPDGGFWLAWVGFDGNDDEIFASHWDGQFWSQPERVGQDDADPLAYDTHPRLAVDDEGHPWLAWVSRQALFDDAVFASRWDGQRWTPEQAVSADDRTADTWPSLALDSEGQPWLAWQDLAGAGADAHLRIYVSRWQAGSATWTAEEMASSPIELPLDEERPDLNFDAAGQAQLVWTVTGASSGVAYASWDGNAWTHAAWAAEQVATDAAILLPGGTPWLVWSDLASTNQIPLDQEQLAGPFSALPDVLPQSEAVVQTDVVLDRYCIWGDSITLGAYDDPMGSGIPVGPYPERLEQKLDSRVRDSEVINLGVSGETTIRLGNRFGPEVGTYRPEFPMIMEGTNDISHGGTPNGIVDRFLIMVDVVKKYVKLKDARMWFSTVIPRQDGLNGPTRDLNDAIRQMVDSEGLYLADSWQAFFDYGHWQDLMRDDLHPNAIGMDLLAENWYQRLLEEHPWLKADTTPPVTWIESLPAQSPCGDVTVHWDGSDNLGSGIEFDVQINVNNGGWTDWIMATTTTSGIYSSQAYGTTLAFRVRGRDSAGNESAYSDPVSTVISDDGPPEVHMDSLASAQKAPIPLSWSGTDLCGQVTAFSVESCVGASCTDSAGPWQELLKSTSKTGTDFTPSSPAYGNTYTFHARARDEAGNWSTWSAPVSTLLARFTLGGSAFNVRDERVVGAKVTVADALAVEVWSSNYVAYVADEGAYDLAMSREGYGVLPPMRGVTATTDIDGLDFFLPPVDDAVEDGGFEAGGWGEWAPGGGLTPTLDAEPHTGDGAVLLGGAGGVSRLSQTLTVPDGLTDATLSFLVRLEDDGDGSSSLQVELTDTPISETLDVSAGGWTHFWFPLDQVSAGKKTTLTFTVSDDATLRLDEVSLGSALKGGYWLYMPTMSRAHAP